MALNIYFVFNIRYHIASESIHFVKSLIDALVAGLINVYLMVSTNS